MIIHQKMKISLINYLQDNQQVNLIVNHVMKFVKAMIQFGIYLCQYGII
jgi:hypothetical protein